MHARAVCMDQDGTIFHACEIDLEQKYDYIIIAIACYNKLRSLDMYVRFACALATERVITHIQLNNGCEGSVCYIPSCSIVLVSHVPVHAMLEL